MRPPNANGAKSAKLVSPKAENAAGVLFQQSLNGSNKKPRHYAPTGHVCASFFASSEISTASLDG